MPMQIYHCEQDGRFMLVRGFHDPVSFGLCPECSILCPKVWDMDSIPMFDRMSASQQDRYYNEQLGVVVRKGRELEDCRPMIEAKQEQGKPVGLDWK